MRKGERRISHLQTRRSASGTGDFANPLQAGEQQLTAEKALGFTPTVPAWRCPAGWQEQALSSFVSAYCHQEVLNMSMSHPRKTCVTAWHRAESVSEGKGRKQLYRLGGKRENKRAGPRVLTLSPEGLPSLWPLIIWLSQEKSKECTHCFLTNANP